MFGTLLLHDKVEILCPKSPEIDSVLLHRLVFALVLLLRMMHCARDATHNENLFQEMVIKLKFSTLYYTATNQTITELV